MAVSYHSRFLAQMKQNEAQMTRLFSAVAATVSRELVRRADADGIIPRSATLDIQQVANDAVARMFLGRDGTGERAPFVVLPDNTVFPLSPYSRVLFARMTDSVQIAVEQQASIIARQLRNAPDVLARFRTAAVNPFEYGKRLVSEQFNPNPLAQYEPPHLWVDPRGYTLSDRIWRTAGVTRRKLDLFLEERIAQGQGALDMARDLETFLLPNRKLKRTGAPYGTDASYDAMRLARTEITRAAAQASELAAEMNPFVKAMSVVLSPSHPKYDICDEAAAASPFPVGEIPDQYRIPLHPHCLCSYHYVLVDNQAEILDRFRADIRNARGGLTTLVGPLMVVRFTKMLMGG